MAAKRFWPRIDLRWVNLSLCGLIGLCAVVWWSELRWAAAELPGVIEARIGSPVERRLYLRAKEQILDGRDLDSARALLERSIAIDPHSDAVYWMGEYFLVVGAADRALEHFGRYLEFDPTRADAYLRTAGILADRGRREEARGVLQRGLAYFVSQRERLEPEPDPEVSMRYNSKAVDLYAYCADSIARLEAELRRVVNQGDGS